MSRLLATMSRLLATIAIHRVLRVLRILRLVARSVHPAHGCRPLVPGGLAQRAPGPTGLTVAPGGAGGAQRAGRRGLIHRGRTPVPTLVEAPTRVADWSVATSPGHRKGLHRRLRGWHVWDMRLLALLLL